MEDKNRVNQSIQLKQVIYWIFIICRVRCLRYKDHMTGPQGAGSSLTGLHLTTIIVGMIECILYVRQHDKCFKQIIYINPHQQL